MWKIEKRKRKVVQESVQFSMQKSAIKETKELVSILLGILAGC
jgi:P2-related tail formation protein